MCDLIGFEKYLRVRGLVVESKVPFFLHWVERYLNLRLDNESVFSDVLDGEGKEDWHIHQENWKTSVRLKRGLHFVSLFR